MKTWHPGVFGSYSPCPRCPLGVAAAFYTEREQRHHREALVHLETRLIPHPLLAALANMSVAPHSKKRICYYYDSKCEKATKISVFGEPFTRRLKAWTPKHRRADME